MAKKRTSKRKPTRKSPRKGKAASNEEQLIEKLRHYIRTNGPRFLDDPNITSLGIGRKITDGKRTKQLCVQFTVRSKPEESGTLPEGVRTSPIPALLDVAGESIPTDVLERDYRPAFHVLELEAVEEVDVRKRRHDPLVPGISVCHPDGSAGTLGMIVFDTRTGDPCMLSNWHVLHGATAEIGDPVVQPGPFDDNNVDENVAGVLIRSHLGPAGDCAIARIENRDYQTDILDLAVTPTQIAQVELDDRVIKSGRTTGVTRGIVRRIDVLASITYDGVGDVAIGAFEIEPLANAPADYEVSMGGDSGSVWLIARQNGNPTDILAGLHFAGEGRSNPDEHALACYAPSVFKKLEISLTPPAEPEALRQLGYNPNFLSETVPIPWLAQPVFDDAFKLGGSHMIPYTHFSVCQSKQRRLPRLVAWNIDGARLKSVSRDGIDFRLDPRVPGTFQAGNELYSHNPLDRGHVARRADLTWGSITEAKKANKDSFFFTNITPQHEAFNQSSKSGLWGKLENAILEDVSVEDLRVSVMAGPIFQDSDSIYRGVKIPRSYWKLVAYRDSDDDRFEVRAYVLTQRDLLHDLEALDLDPFRLFQISLSKLQGETGLDFGELENFDTFAAGREALGPEVREIAGRGDVV